MDFISRSENDTIEIGKKIASSLGGGDILGLVGNLGAGKTFLTKVIASEIGVKQIVTSPTFVLMKVYDIKKNKKGIKKLIHIDAYRIKSSEDIKAIGAEEYFNRNDSITIIEWADRIKKLLPKKTKNININIINNKRLLTFK